MIIKNYNIRKLLNLNISNTEFDKIKIKKINNVDIQRMEKTIQTSKKQKINEMRLLYDALKSERNLTTQNKKIEIDSTYLKKHNLEWVSGCGNLNIKNKETLEKIFKAIEQDSKTEHYTKNTTSSKEINKLKESELCDLFEKINPKTTFERMSICSLIDKIHLNYSTPKDKIISKFDITASRFYLDSGFEIPVGSKYINGNICIRNKDNLISIDLELKRDGLEKINKKLKLGMEHLNLDLKHKIEHVLMYDLGNMTPDLKKYFNDLIYRLLSIKPKDEIEKKEINNYISALKKRNEINLNEKIPASKNKISVNLSLNNKFPSSVRSDWSSENNINNLIGDLSTYRIDVGDNHELLIYIPSYKTMSFYGKVNITAKNDDKNSFENIINKLNSFGFELLRRDNNELVDNHYKSINDKKESDKQNLKIMKSGGFYNFANIGLDISEIKSFSHRLRFVGGDVSVKDVFENGFGLYSFNERVEFIKSNKNLSSNDDISDYGTKYIFTSKNGIKNKANLKDINLIFKNNLAYRTDMILDRTGSKIDPWLFNKNDYSSEYQWNLFKSNIDFSEYLNYITTDTEEEKNNIINELKDIGFSKWIDGRELSDFVILNSEYH
ncbi:hypothetical protein VII00023_03453 [Vibrio ichthyoenteri ATCC 700023]|uniref:Uncharacterized protein n=1 Tax=Vibrio ichthyoenteri ATCC 700023 TaxID=870968 RepID=F9S2C4_9VIBR|nr:hypothetical protein [Vibrio ichthyoenteri]EGU39830.1 hypothetical protein VII00023_03453 [Vibrio ichthyoenteri ATCC 700023]